MKQKKGAADTREVANTCTATEGGGLPQRAEGRNYSQPEFEVKLLVGLSKHSRLAWPTIAEQEKGHQQRPASWCRSGMWFQPTQRGFAP